ncbi:MAG: hypothetical protein L0212_06990 [Acidobacteria bacterium]|nr:hypothetical protein [Acidobacteriota bacterium]
MVAPKRTEKEKTLTLLEKVAEKVRLQTLGARGVNISVFPAAGSAEAYAIEFSKARIVRRVNVDVATVRRLQLRTSDPLLVRALRTALLIVVARAREREVKP